MIAGRENGFSAKERSVIVTAAVRSYRERMREFAGMGNLDVWYTRADMEELQPLADRRLGARGRKGLSKSMTKAPAGATVSRRSRS